MLGLLRNDASRCYDHYAEMLNEDDAGRLMDPARQGLARELARMNLTLNTYTQWYWKTDLHNLLHFCRCVPTPTRNTRSASMPTRSGHGARWVPAAYEAFRDYRLGAATLSAQMLAVLQRMLAGEAVEQAGSGLSKREWSEMMAALGRAG